MFNFKCNNCGLCCSNFSTDRYVILFPVDILNISRKISINENDFLEQYCKKKIIKFDDENITIFILKNNNGKCLFLTINNLCLIHRFKPYQCKYSPLEFLWNNDDVYYPCMKNINVPNNWSTEKKDEKIFSTLFINNKL
jgi:Fe-S-cluster containining protein